MLPNIMFYLAIPASSFFHEASRDVHLLISQILKMQIQSSIRCRPWVIGPFTYKTLTGAFSEPAVNGREGVNPRWPLVAVLKIKSLNHSSYKYV